MEKPLLRNNSIGTKMSDEEYAQLENLAEARGLTLKKHTIPQPCFVKMS